MMTFYSIVCIRDEAVFVEVVCSSVCCSSCWIPLNACPLPENWPFEDYKSHVFDYKLDQSFLKKGSFLTIAKAMKIY